jgi:hypothetical protein
MDVGVLDRLSRRLAHHSHLGLNAAGRNLFSYSTRRTSGKRSSITRCKSTPVLKSKILVIVDALESLGRMSRWRIG